MADQVPSIQLNNGSLSSSGDSEMSAEKILELLQSRQRSERDQGLAKVDKLLKLGSEECQSHDPVLIQSVSKTLEDVQSLIIERLQRCDDLSEEMNGEHDGSLSVEELWGIKHGCLSASLKIILKQNDSNLEGSCQFTHNLQELTMRLICDQDVRVRLLVGDIMGGLCKRLGPEVYEAFRERISDLINDELRSMFNMDYDLKDGICGSNNSSSVSDHSAMEMDQDEGHSSSSVAVSSSSETNHEMSESGGEAASSSFDRITVFEASPKGVRSSKLETLLKLLINTVVSLGSRFRPFVDRDFVEMVLNTLQHPNRFVREAGFTLCSTLIDSDCIDYDADGPILADKLSTGLSDLCSQTRIAAAIATRKHILRVHNSQRDKFFPVLLPRLCLCRYFMADTKFLLYSQESWRLIVNTDGPQLVEKYIEQVVTYYLEATRSENHAVREAACACIAELSRKINPQLVRPYIPKLLDALRRSFHDERWHVRDAACLGCANFVLNFPEECKTERDNLLLLFYENLGFPISVVRQGAASSIASTIRAYGNEVLPGVIERIVFGLEGVSRQLPDDCCGLTSLTISPETRYSYPPGPWAQFIPYARPSQPWEFGDGCLYLIGDISPIPECQSQLSPLIPVIIKASQARSFSHHVVFLETLCKIVPPLAKGIGKKPFKEFLALFFEPIFYSIECENPQTAAAGKLCLQQLAVMYGPNILKSRIEQFDSRFVHYVEGYNL